MSIWVYIQSEPDLLTVGFYSPDGKWHSDSDHTDREAAARRCHYLNGGRDKLPDLVAEMERRERVRAIARRIDPDCWASYAGKPRKEKQRIEERRQYALAEARKEVDGGG